ncbi:MAG: sigma 54-interacting transcriptional regulator [Oscillospiraceae bacterium]|nr:sigma 54-interacting transcriptional regulator [Oscillospiraceae bacterium]
MEEMIHLDAGHRAQIGDELAAILDAALDDVLVTDGNGQVILVSAKFKQMYGVNGEDVIGQNVFTLERQGVFKPSITKLVIEQKQKVTMVQENREGRKIIVSAVPVKDGDGNITKIVSFSRDVTELMELQEQYRKLERKIEFYSNRLHEWETRDLKSDLFIGKSKAMQTVIGQIHKIAKFDANVLLTGESGVGKTMFARLIHENSARSGVEPVEVNCGAIPETLVESELFGYEAGSFTGANKKGKLGLMELASGGTLLLDEVSEIPFSLQVKLLKVIQDKAITRVGGVKSLPVDFRLIAASNKDLRALVSAGGFREDLYYRLNVIHIEIPALRQRQEDIFALALYFLEKFNLKYNLKKILTSDTVDALARYNWPGNIRELENLIERLVLTADADLIEEAALPEYIQSERAAAAGSASLDAALTGLEKKMVTAAYQKHKTTVGVARELGISQPTAVRKIRKHVGR